MIDGGMVYPTGVYEDYNLYLIGEYEKFVDVIINHSDISVDPEIERIKMSNLISDFIEELKDLLENNTGEPKDIFAVMSWEEILVQAYDRLDFTYKHNNVEYKIRSIESFLRKEKLKRISDV